MGCMGKILGFLVEPAITHGAYVIRYKEKVDELKRTYSTLLENKISILDRVVEEENNGNVIIGTEYSSWLMEVKRMELEIENNQNIAIFLRQQKDEGRMKDDFLLQQMERNFQPRQGKGERMQQDFINFLIQQENGEQMEQDFANFLLHQQEDGESFRCFTGCMCPNLMWRYKRGKEAENRKKEVSELIIRGNELQNSLQTRYAYSRSELSRVSSQYYTEFQSRASVVDRIMDYLKSSEVHMIGVLGPGGIGKTTIVKEVAKVAMARGIFHEFVIAVVSKNQNNPEILKQLVSGLRLKCEENEQRTALTNKLLVKNRKILVILDDLWQLLDLNDIGIPISSRGDKGFKILLTSRNEEVFREMDVRSCVRLGYLEKQETWELFKKVIDGDFGVDGSTARMVSEKCGDLPIAIVAVGAALKGKDNYVWLDALDQLENQRVKYIERNVPEGYTPLKLSYDFLKDEDAKSCFLLCCLFPEGAEIPIDDLVRYSFALRSLSVMSTLEKARYRVQTVVDTLKMSCLLLNGENKNFVKMHDVIRDIAISITKERQIEHDGGLDWPGKQHFMVDHNIRKWPKNDSWEHYTAISLRINDAHIHFPYCPLMHTLVLMSGKCSLKIPNDFFLGMKAARVLDLEDISMDLPSSVLGLDHLRMLRLNIYHYLGDLSTIQNLKNHIEILSLGGNTIFKLPQEIGNLTRLQSLDLRECRILMMIPKDMISNLIHLEELYVTQRFKNWDTTTEGMSNASIGELKSLNKLTVLHVLISANSYRIMVQECRHLFEKLINFAICINPNIGFGDQSPNVLEIYDIDSTHDEFCLLMDRVEKLRLSNIQGLRYLCGKPQLQFTSSGRGSFCKLIELCISGCHSTKYLFPPSCPKAFQQLKTLSVYDCRKMEQIIGVGDYYNENEVATEEAIIFSQLEMINLSKLPQFRSFYPKMEKTTVVENLSNWTTTRESIFNEKVFFPVLEELTIDELSVKDIWNKQMIQSPKGSNKVSFSQLKKIEVIRCCNLVNVFPSNMLIRLQNLETLRVRECLSLILLVDEDLKPNIQSPTVKFKLTEVFPKLRDLYLDDLPKLMKIWPNDEDYHSNDNYVHLYLRTISIRLCHSLTHAFSAFVARHLASIEELRVNGCLGMEVIVSEENGEGVIDDGIITFCQLKALELKNLPNLKSFSQSKSEASHSFNHQVIFPKIKYLYLGDLKSSKEIRLWDLLGTTQEHLHTVNIFGCQVSTKDSFHHQKRRSGIVDNLLLQNCQGFKHFIDLNGTISIGEEQFADVKKLKLCDLPELMVLWNKNLHEIGGLRSLKEIIIINCSQLRSLFTHSMAMTLQQLKLLIVTSCEMMEEIIIIEENNINFAGKEKATHHIEFPKLKWLILDDLPNLKNFCSDERGSFSFTSLHTIVVQNCPKMKTFAFGQICLPPRMIKAFVGYERIELEPRMEERSVEYRRIEITNLNAFFEYWNADNNCFLEDYSDKDEYYLDADIWNKYDSYTFNKFYPRVDISSEDYYDDIAKLFKRRIHFPIGYLKEEPEA